ncbi:MAG: hypothetical protein QME90_04835 [Thermodesulfobacteriota bacterium]|nr:hypothetical protein [Thermodesulfobacteriota bacterium]
MPATYAHLMITDKALERFGANQDVDQKSKFILYKDLGRTVTLVDYPYWRKVEKVPCER